MIRFCLLAATAIFLPVGAVQAETVQSPDGRIAVTSREGEGST